MLLLWVCFLWDVAKVYYVDRGTFEGDWMVRWGRQINVYFVGYLFVTSIHPISSAIWGSIQRCHTGRKYVIHTDRNNFISSP